MQPPVRTGQYYICKKKGEKNDLIVGKVISVRRNGDVIIESLISNKLIVKPLDTVQKRCAKVIQDTALIVVDTYKTSGIQAAKSRAIELASPDKIESALPAKNGLKIEHPKTETVPNTQSNILDEAKILLDNFYEDLAELLRRKSTWHEDGGILDLDRVRQPQKEP